jgi:hypothetical protein
MQLPGGRCGAWRRKERLRPRYRGYRVDTLLHYSLPWHPDESSILSRKELLRAAYGSIRALVTEDRKALIICHNQAAPHLRNRSQ